MHRRPSVSPTPIVRAVAVLAVSLAASSGWTQTLTAGDAPALSVVTVQGTRAAGLRPETVEAGTFRGADIMDVPSTVNVVTREALDAQAASGVYDALRNTAGVTRQQNGGETWDQLVIRGIEVQNRTNYRLNGSLPVMNFGQVPLEDKERVEVLKGASALYYGFTSPSGVVNFVTKRAGSTPVSSLGLSVDQYGSAVATADIGRRFGDNGEYGLRINAAGGTLGSYMDGVGNGNRAFLSAAFDWRVTQRLTLKADFEHERRRTTEQVGIQLPAAVGGTIALPAAVDPKKLVGPSWARFQTETTNAQLRADYALSDDWSLTVEAGRAHTERERNLPVFRFNGNTAAAVATGAGSIRGNSQRTDVTSELLRAELFGTLRTGAVRHEVTLGASRTDFSQDPVYQRAYTIASQNLYRPSAPGTAAWGAVPTAPTTAALDTRDTGLYLVDRMQLSSQWQLIGGLRHSSYRSDQGTDHYDVTKTTPLAALVCKPTDRLSVYASYAQGLEPGEAGPAGTVNEAQRLQPGVSKQKEIGLRWLAGNGTLWSAALFDIAQPGYYTNAANVYVADGTKRYTGLELSAQGQLSRQLGWQASAQWLDPRFEGIGLAYDGKRPENAARRTASAFLSYDIAAVTGLSVNGGAYFTGRRPVNDLNQGFLGGNTVFAAGLRYMTRVQGLRTTWQLNVENLADKRYWAAGGSRLAAGAPRTVKLLAKVDF